MHPWFGNLSVGYDMPVECTPLGLQRVIGNLVLLLIEALPVQSMHTNVRLIVIWVFVLNFPNVATSMVNTCYNLKHYMLFLNSEGQGHSNLVYIS